MKRGSSFASLRRWDEAIVDYRAAVAAFRMIGAPETRPTWDGWPTYGEANGNLINAMLRQKISLENPCFTHEERESLLKEVGTGHYFPQAYKCLECAASTKLRMCTGCYHALYCDQECQRWKTGHKEKCKARTVHVFVEKYEAALQEIAQNGFIVSLYSARLFFIDYPVAVTRDPSTGEVFDMIRSEDIVVFSEPAELARCNDTFNLRSLQWKRWYEPYLRFSQQECSSRSSESYRFGFWEYYSVRVIECAIVGKLVWDEGLG